MDVMTRSFAAVALAAAVLAGCKKEEPAPPPEAAAPAAPAPAVLAVTGLTLGAAIGPDNRVTVPRDVFNVRDTIYVSVTTDGVGDNVKLKAVWAFGSETVRADSLMLNLAGPTISEFHISRPRAWPVGTYKVTVTLNDAGAQAIDFTVR